MVHKTQNMKKFQVQKKETKKSFLHKKYINKDLPKGAYFIVYTAISMYPDGEINTEELYAVIGYYQGKIIGMEGEIGSLLSEEDVLELISESTEFYEEV